MARADDDNGVEVMALDQQVDVGPDEDEPGAGTPVTWEKRAFVSLIYVR